jgi:hypothetical protein
MAEAQNITVKTGGNWWLLLIGIVIGVAVGLYVREWFQGGEITKSSDTTYVKETLRVPYPIEVNRFKDQSIMMIPLWLKSEKKVKDTVVVNDTVFLSVHREFKEYRGASYFARVSGYSPSLDYIEVYPETKVITNTERVVYKNFLSAGIDVGYMERFHAPIYMEYERLLHKNIRVRGKILYDLPSKKLGAEAGVNFGFGW